MDDVDRKKDIMDHVNNDHGEEVLEIARCYCPDLDIASVRIKDIYREGVLLGVKSAEEERDVFAAFELDGEPEEQVFYLAYRTMVRQGKDLSSHKKKYFRVIDKKQLTPNIIRLVLHSDTPFPEDYAGHAYGMMLKTLQRLPESAGQKRTDKPWDKYANLFFLWLMKKLSGEKRRKLFGRMNKDTRLYTLRAAYRQEGDEGTAYCGLMDVFLHGDSPGSVWARHVRMGDIVCSRSETPDKHGHLAQGHAVLVADETGYPALAGILECWTNPLPPHVFVVGTAREDTSYFDDFSFPEGTRLHIVTASCEEQGDRVVEHLKTISRIDVSWGALENEAAKTIRHYLRNERKLSGEHNRVKAYWRLIKP